MGIGTVLFHCISVQERDKTGILLRSLKDFSTKMGESWGGNNGAVNGLNASMSHRSAVDFEEMFVCLVCNDAGTCDDVHLNFLMCKQMYLLLV